MILIRNWQTYGNYIPYVIETSIGLDRMFLTDDESMLMQKKI